MSKSNQGGWSGSNNMPSYPGDGGGNTFTYTTPVIPSSSGNYGFSGNASIFTSNGSNGAPQPSGGGVGFTIHF
jgi:hypothetical protein